MSNSLALLAQLSQCHKPFEPPFAYLVYYVVSPQLFLIIDLITEIYCLAFLSGRNDASTYIRIPYPQKRLPPGPQSSRHTIKLNSARIQKSRRSHVSYPENTQTGNKCLEYMPALSFFLVN